MKTQNSVERNKAFTNFLIFFSITIGIILTCVFVSFRVPLKENEQLKAERETLRMQNENREDFVQVMDTTMKLLESVNRSEVKAEVVESDIDEYIGRLNTIAKSDVSNGKFLLNIVFTLSDLKKAKRQLREVSSRDENVNSLSQKNESLQSRLDQANIDLEICRTTVTNLTKQLR